MPQEVFFPFTTCTNKRPRIEPAKCSKTVINNGMENVMNEGKAKAKQEDRGTYVTKCYQLLITFQSLQFELFLHFSTFVDPLAVHEAQKR